jgi:hypothetical protein
MVRNDKKAEIDAQESTSAPLKETLEEFFARIDALKGDPLFPEGRKQNLAPIRDYPWDERPPKEDPTL